MEKKNRKSRTGLVIAKKLDKTATVLCERKYIHPVYGKVVKAFSKFLAQDNENKAMIGDKVMIEETRPLSSRKRFRIVKYLGKGEVFKRELPKKKEKEAHDTGTEQTAGS